MRPLLAILLILWSQTCNGADRELWSAHVDVQMVAIDPQQAITLLPELQRAETADAAIKKVQAMIATDRAELLGWPHATAATGHRATSEGGEGLRYPDYEQWRFGFSVSNQIPPAITARMLPYHRSQHWGPQTATDFETRLLGPALEFEATASETGASIVLGFSLRDFEFARFKELHGTPSPAKIAGTKVLTEFRSRTYSSKVTVQHGKRMLLTSYVEQRPQPRVILYLLRASAQGSRATKVK